MSTQTHRAHCGACGEIMVLCRDYRGGRGIPWVYWYICHVCGVETPARETVQDADADVIWVPVKPAVTRNR